MARFSLPLAGGAGRSLRGTAGLLRSLREQARLRDVPSLLDDGVAVDVEAGDVFSATGLFGDILGSFLKELLLPVDSSAARKRANKRSKNLKLDSNKGTEDYKNSLYTKLGQIDRLCGYRSMQNSRGG